MNVANARRVAARLRNLAEGEVFTMRSYLAHGSFSKHAGGPIVKCATAGCIAGWTVMECGTPEERVRCARNSGLANGIAMVVLGLKPGTEAASTLFHPTEARDTEAGLVWEDVTPEMAAQLLDDLATLHEDTGETLTAAEVGELWTRTAAWRGEGDA